MASAPLQKLSSQIRALPLMVLFILFALLTLTLQICERNAAPDEQQWREAQTIITGNFESGDIIRVSPS